MLRRIMLNVSTILALFVLFSDKARATDWLCCYQVCHPCHWHCPPLPPPFHSHFALAYRDPYLKRGLMIVWVDHPIHPVYPPKEWNWSYVYLSQRHEWVKVFLHLPIGLSYNDAQNALQRHQTNSNATSSSEEYPPRNNAPSVSAQMEMQSARVLVTLPSDARLIVDGKETRATSDIRTFDTPPLEPNETYVYSMEARVVRNGQLVAIRKQAVVRAGQDTRVNFDMGIDNVVAVK